MILALDIGNTNIVFGGMEDGETKYSFCLSSDLSRTVDEYAAILSFSAAARGADMQHIDGTVICSVVPQLTGTMVEAIRRLSGKTPLVVGPGVKTGLNIRIDEPGELGSDFVAAAVAALHEGKLPCVTIDMGTAIGIGVLDAEGHYIGGAICPGLAVSVSALARNTAQLPKVALQAPGSVIGKSTTDGMRSGLFYGTAAMLDGLVDRIESELGQSVHVLATGDLAPAITPLCRRSMEVDEDLIMRGLWLIWQRNKRG